MITWRPQCCQFVCGPNSYCLQVRAGCVLGLNCATGVIPLPEASLFMPHVFESRNKENWNKFQQGKDWGCRKPFLRFRSPERNTKPSWSQIYHLLGWHFLGKKTWELYFGESNRELLKIQLAFHWLFVCRTHYMGRQIISKKMVDR